MYDIAKELGIETAEALAKLNELGELPISKDNLDWVTKELDQLIDEEEVRQTKL